MDDIAPIEPVIAGYKPHLCTLKAGRNYAWCACGRSRRQPYCDGRSHIGTGIEPLSFAVGRDDEELLLCVCKKTATPPFCDGTHSNLPGGYSEDRRTEEEREALPWHMADGEGVSRLDGHCYIVSPTATRPDGPAGFWWRSIVAPSTGSVYQSQFYFELTDAVSPILSARAGDLLLWIVEGVGEVEISGRRMAVAAESGVYVRAAEAFRLFREGAAPMTGFVSACPAVEGLDELAGMPDDFDAAWPVRVCGVDPEQRRATGPRYFQMLVDKTVGSATAAQFIGHIPPSRAAMHRHLYEEALIIMSGKGILWNEGSRAHVAAGDIVFLPRKHAHSLESLGPDGMDVVGVIHPGDNPGINF
jgi:mannose-6-phosphate isomerase-like protein (cupin superfamily)